MVERARRQSTSRLLRFWDESRAYYELAIETNRDEAPERHWLFSHLAGGERVLDLGSGSCENSQWLPAGCRYVGLDISTMALVMAAEQGRPALGVRGDAGLLPFADEAFDAVISTWSIEHLHDPGATFAEVASVLKPGGWLLLVGSAWDLPYSLAVSVPAARRCRVVAASLLTQLRSWLDGRHRFDIVRRPAALSSNGSVPDSDAVHLTQGVFVCRYLRAVGFEIVAHESLVHRSRPSGVRRLVRAVLRCVPIWRRGWGNLLIIARRGAVVARPPYALVDL